MRAYTIVAPTDAGQPVSFSCNVSVEIAVSWQRLIFSQGFDESVPQETVELLGFDNVWKHLNSVHKESPMHLLIWGGDQIYIDFIFEDIPFLKRWLKFDWDTKWKHEFSEETSRYVGE